MKRTTLKAIGIALVILIIEDYIELWCEFIKGEWIHMDDLTDIAKEIIQECREKNAI